MKRTIPLTGKTGQAGSELLPCLWGRSGHDRCASLLPVGAAAHSSGYVPRRFVEPLVWESTCEVSHSTCNMRLSTATHAASWEMLTAQTIPLMPLVVQSFFCAASAVTQ